MVPVLNWFQIKNEVPEKECVTGDNITFRLVEGNGKGTGESECLGKLFNIEEHNNTLPIHVT